MRLRITSVPEAFQSWPSIMCLRFFNTVKSNPEKQKPEILNLFGKSETFKHLKLGTLKKKKKLKNEGTQCHQEILTV